MQIHSGRINDPAQSTRSLSKKSIIKIKNENFTLLHSYIYIQVNCIFLLVRSVGFMMGYGLIFIATPSSLFINFKIYKEKQREYIYIYVCNVI